MALVSFDLDGVLQRNPFHAGRPDGVFGHIQRELAPYVTGDPEAAFKEALRLILDEHHARMQANRLVEAYDWDEIINLVAGGLGYPGQIDVPGVMLQYVARPDLTYAYPGAHECLQALQDQGHTLVTITNGYRCYQEPILKQLGLLPFFTALISPDGVGTMKPMTPIFRAAEVYSDGPYVHVGDTMSHDVAGPRRAGWKAIYIVQPGAGGYAELPPAARDLAPWERPAAAGEWLQERVARDRRLNANPPVADDECLPDAIVTSLAEVPGTVAHLVR